MLDDEDQNLQISLLPEKLPVSAKSTVLVSHVDGPSHFYAQPCATSHLLSELIFEMKKVYSDETNILHIIYVPYVGMLCAAHYKADNCWYRAEIIELLDGARVEVQFIDFGNREVLHQREIRKLITCFTKLNIQAVPCTLADVTYVEGSEWSEKATDWFKTQVGKKVLSLMSLGNVPDSRVTNAVLYVGQGETEICINALMVENSLASSTGPNSIVVNMSSLYLKECTSIPFPTDDLQNASPAVQNEKNVSSPVPSKTLVLKEEPKNHVKIHVSYIESPACFFIRIADNVEERFKGLMNMLQDAYRDSTDFPSEISIGGSYAVFRIVDKTWYRGIVLSKVADGSYEVRFVDFGFVDIVCFKNFRVLSEEYTADAAFAVECHLAGILPTDGSNKWSHGATDMLKELVSAHEVLCLVGEGNTENNSLSSDILYKEVVRGGALEPSTVVFQSVREKLIEKGVAIPVRKRNDLLTKSCPNSAFSYDGEHGDTSMQTIYSQSTISTNVKDISLTGQTTFEMSNSEIPTSIKPTFQWKKTLMPTKMKFACRPSHVAEDGCIYVQPKPEGTNKVELISRALEFKFSGKKLEKLKVSPPVGQAVTAKFPLDKNWYRAEIVSNSNVDKIKVQFIDFGNCEFVVPEDICTDAPLKDVPAQVLECELFDTRPGEGKFWRLDVLNYLHECIVDQSCTVEILAPPEMGKRLVISLTLEDGTDVSDLLKKNKMAVSVQEYEQRLEYEQHMECESGADSSPEEENVEDKLPFPRNNLPVGESFRVCIIEFFDPNIICLQCVKVEKPLSESEKLCNLHLSQFLELMDELMLKAESFPKITDPKVGSACCARYTFDNKWYRCLITEINSDGIRVFYVDYGNSEVVPLERLRMLDSPFLDFPVQAHICKIHGLELVTDRFEEAKQALVEKLFCASTEIYASVVVPGDICEVDLLVMDSDRKMHLIYSDIVELGLAKLRKS